MKLILQILWWILGLISLLFVLWLIYVIYLNLKQGWWFSWWMFTIVAWIILWIIPFIRCLKLESEANYRTYIAFTLFPSLLIIVTLIINYLMEFMSWNAPMYLIWALLLFIVMTIISIIQWKEEYGISIIDMLKQEYK